MEQCRNLGEASARFLGTLPPQDRERSQQEVNRFARWWGINRALEELSAPDIARYGEQICSLSSDPAKALEPVKAFLAYARKTGLTGSNLSVHLRVRKMTRATGRAQAEKSAVEPIPMTALGYAQLEAELRSLEEQRPHVVDEIRKAAADKDFRENAPLQAAKEQQGHLEGRIQELEATLRSAKVVSEKKEERIGLGDYVLLSDLASGDEFSVTLMHPTEANPILGKISLASPTGKALLGHKLGDIVEVVAPAGRLRYRIARVNANPVSPSTE